MEHKKLPKLALGFMNQGLGHGHYAVLREESGELFANVPFGDKNLAAQVVRACNAHEDLLAICEAIQEKIDSGEHLRADDPECQDLKAAITAAGGE